MSYSRTIKVRTEIGARGKDDDVAKALESLRETNSAFWWRGMYDEEGNRSIGEVAWSQEDNLDKSTAVATELCSKLSEENPDVEIFFLVTEEPVYGRVSNEIRYAEYENGSARRGETFISHNRWTEVHGDCLCASRGSYYDKYPNETPFADCPIRLNPPTAWAVENIMEAHERIGMR